MTNFAKVVNQLDSNPELAKALLRNEMGFQFSLKEAREAKGMTLAQVAETLGITEAMAEEVESPDVNPTLSEIRYYLWAIGAYYTTEIHFAEELKS